MAFSARYAPMLPRAPSPLYHTSFSPTALLYLQLRVPTLFISGGFPFCLAFLPFNLVLTLNPQPSHSLYQSATLARQDVRTIAPRRITSSPSA
ncbi:hypothetical protein CKAH01_01509 [Colletotrichum kahawae]|uniref:Uncharacterized protein n=1 Tax=Colletotrichum kahawae TaxID=34407 RepID=A0AAD9Y7E4_COLKA|nr:hypothetical protein CKAH01_01509 [Colletotrichum kahawae]